MESQLNVYKREHSRLQKKLMDNEEIIKRMMYTNAELMGQLDKAKLQTAKLRGENDTLHSVVQKLLRLSGFKSIDELPAGENDATVQKKPKIQEVTATGHLVFGDPLGNRKFEGRDLSNLVQACQEYMQLYASKNNALAEEIHERRISMRDLQKENEKLKQQCGKMKASESAAERQTQVDSRMQRLRLRQLIFRSFTYLGIEDLMNVSLVCVAFFTKCSEMFGDVEYWKQSCSADCKIPRSRLWVRYMSWQHPAVLPTKKAPARNCRKDSTEVAGADEARAEATKDCRMKPGDKNGFFDCNYAFFESPDLAPNDVAGIGDYSLANPENLRCDLAETFSPGLLAHFGFTAPSAGTASKDSESVQQIMAELQQTYGLKLAGQGLAVVAGFLYLVMRRRRENVLQLLGGLLDTPYHLRKLYAEDYYLLNLVIFQVDYLMRLKIPDLYFHLKDENVTLHDFLVEWVLTLLSCEVRAGTNRGCRHRHTFRQRCS